MPHLSFSGVRSVLWAGACRAYKFESISRGRRWIVARRRAAGTEPFSAKGSRFHAGKMFVRKGFLSAKARKGIYEKYTKPLRPRFDVNSLHHAASMLLPARSMEGLERCQCRS